ncbi:hypothetical protein FPSE5266_00727 [Fusarium pseudograminearum]|nr:hypothetical protein FPSE5266_00727 [Fusarium pseudograminearum]
MNQEPLPKVPQDEGDEGSRSIIYIEYKSQIKRLVRDLIDLPADSPSIYLDASGIGNNILDDLQLFILPTNTLYLVDLIRLGDAAFSTVGNGEKSLRLVLESKSIPKAGFDIRDLSRLLFRQYNISLAGIYDIQLMELASRKEGQSMKFLAGLAKCIDRDISNSDDRKIRWLNPAQPSNLYVHNTMGHAPKYIMRRVEMFPVLWSLYKQNLDRPENAMWLHLARQESEQRVHDSKKNAGRYPERQRWGPEVFWDVEQRKAAIGAWNDGKILDKSLGGIEFCDD